MSPQSIDEALRTLSKVHTRRLTATRHLAIEVGSHQIGVVQRVLDQDWAGLSQQGSRQVELARRYWDGILKKRRQVSESEKLARATDRELAKRTAESLAVLEDPDFVRDARQHLKKKGLAPAEVEAWFASLRDTLSPSADIPGRAERLKEVTKELDERATLLALLALLGIECRWVARLNRLARGRGPRTPVSDQLAHWENVLQTQEAAIENTDRKAYGLLQMGDWEGLSAHADAVIHEALTARSAGWTLIDATVALHKLRGRPLTDPAERARANAVAARCGGLIRRQLLSYAIAFRLAYVAAIGGETARGRAERKRAQEDPFESLSPQGTPVSLADLVADPGAYDGQMIAVDGEVRDLVTKVARGKATSNFQLADPVSGAAISVFVPYVQIDSTGLVDGCAAHLVGPWLKYDRESRQENTLHIDRIAFTEQAKRSWLDYQTSQARAFCDYLPHNLNMAWSWEAGVPGAVNQVYHTTVWARGMKGD
jgi:hypothetical protein